MLFAILLDASSFIAPEWITAIGTCSAVFVALFLSPIKRFYYRPKIEFTFDGKNDLFVKEIQEQKLSQENDVKIKIRVNLYNDGRGSAKNASVFIDSYAMKQADETYKLKQFDPIQLRNNRGELITKLLPNLNFYIDVLVVQKEDSNKEKDEKGNPKQFYKIYIFNGNGDAINIGTGHCVIPIKCYAENVKKIKVRYLSVCFDEDKWSDANSVKTNLNAHFMSDKEYNVLKIVK